jgi:hypothetical protein
MPFPGRNVVCARAAVDAQGVAEQDLSGRAVDAIDVVQGITAADRRSRLDRADRVVVVPIGDRDKVLDFDGRVKGP